MEASDAPAFVPLPVRRWPCLGQRAAGSEGAAQSGSPALNPGQSVAPGDAAPLEARDDRDFLPLPLRRWSCVSQRAR
jgi:hypothetical protein